VPLGGQVRGLSFFIIIMNMKLIKDMSILQNPIINKTGLACQIWNDTDPNTLRKRLDQKFDRKTLQPEEKAAILSALELLYKQAKIELSPE
jgi:hypothetical protein